MLPGPNNIYTNRCQVDVTQLLHLQKNENSDAVINPIDLNKHRHDGAGINLIDFMDDVCKPTQKTDEMNKEKLLTDLQNKMLEEFCTTSRAKQNDQTEFHRSVSSDPLELEYQNFFNQIEYKCYIKPSPPVHKLKYEDLLAFEQMNDSAGKHQERVLEENACTSNFVYHFDITPKILTPKLDNEDPEPETKKEEDLNEDLIEEVMFAKSLEMLRLTGATPNQEGTILRSLSAKTSRTNLTPEINTSMDNNKFDITRQHLIEHSRIETDKFSGTHETKTQFRIKTLESLVDQLEKYNERNSKFAEAETNSNNYKDPLLAELMAGPIDYTDKNAVRETRTKNLESLVEQTENLKDSKKSHVYTDNIFDQIIKNNQIKNMKVEDDKFKEVRNGIMKLEQSLKHLENSRNLNRRENYEGPLSSPDRVHFKEEIKRKTSQANLTAKTKSSLDNKKSCIDPNYMLDEIAMNNRIKYLKAASNGFGESQENDTEHRLKNSDSLVDQFQRNLKFEQKENIRTKSQNYTIPLQVEFNAASVNYNDDEAAREIRIKKLESLVKQLINHSKLNPEFENEYNPRKNFGNDENPLHAKFKNTQKQLAENMVTEHDIKYLEAVKKIDKTFQKRSVLKSDSDKLALTPGPGLLEKMAYLPQIMARVEERQRQEKLRDSWHMRPILIAKQLSESSLSNPVEHKMDTLTPPETLMADCNKERLNYFEVSRLFNNFVRYSNK